MSRRGGRAFHRCEILDGATDDYSINASNQIKSDIRRRDRDAAIMEYNEEDDDIKLARASAGLLADLESCLPKVLWKPSRTKAERGRVHSHVRRKDLDYTINLVCTFNNV
jgi:hypothetical protein